MYYNGYGVEQDYKEAFKWYKRSAEHNCSREFRSAKKGPVMFKRI
jgi:TPR repeat protein